jgi:hypothetical protein
LVNTRDLPISEALPPPSLSTSLSTAVVRVTTAPPPLLSWRVSPPSVIQRVVRWLRGVPLDGNHLKAAHVGAENCREDNAAILSAVIILQDGNENPVHRHNNNGREEDERGEEAQDSPSDS